MQSKTIYVNKLKFIKNALTFNIIIFLDCNPDNTEFLDEAEN